jgi:hypothetical protein
MINRIFPPAVPFPSSVPSVPPDPSPWRAAVAACVLCGWEQHVTYCEGLDDPEQLECCRCHNLTAAVTEHRGPDGEKPGEECAA